jgi:hypothetical protein
MGATRPFLNCSKCGLRRIASRAANLSGAADYSSTIVTGPSFTSSTCIRAPKTPVSTGTPRPPSAAAKCSYRGSATSGRAAPENDGRFPLAVSAMRVNWLTTRAAPPTSTSERSNFPSPFSKIRSRAILRASLSASTSVSPSAMPSRTSRPAPIAPPGVERARATRWTTALS